MSGGLRRALIPLAILLTVLAIPAIAQAGALSVTLPAMGQLEAAAIAANGGSSDFSQVTSLTVSGASLGIADFRFLRNGDAPGSRFPSLARLDLSGAGNYTLPDNALNGESGHFPNLAAVDLPRQWMHAGRYALANLSKLQALDTSGLRSAFEGAFSGCSSLRTLDLSRLGERIDAELCSGCTSLTALKLSSRTQSIGTRAFFNCPKLLDVDLKTAPTLFNQVLATDAEHMRTARLTVQVGVGRTYFGEQFCSVIDGTPTAPVVLRAPSSQINFYRHQVDGLDYPAGLITVESYADHVEPVIEMSSFTVDDREGMQDDVEMTIYVRDADFTTGPLTLTLMIRDERVSAKQVIKDNYNFVKFTFPKAQMRTLPIGKHPLIMCIDGTDVRKEIYSYEVRPAIYTNKGPLMIKTARAVYTSMNSVRYDPAAGTFTFVMFIHNRTKSSYTRTGPLTLELYYEGKLIATQVQPALQFQSPLRSRYARTCTFTFPVSESLNADCSFYVFQPRLSGTLDDKVRLTPLQRYARNVVEDPSAIVDGPLNATTSKRR